MTQAKISVRDNWARVEVIGHAGDARVCAGVSALCCAVLCVLGDLAGDVVYESGEVRFSAHLSTERDRGALDVLIFGLKRLEKDFCGCVGVTLDM